MYDGGALQARERCRHALVSLAAMLSSQITTLRDTRYAYAAHFTTHDGEPPAL